MGRGWPPIHTAHDSSSRKKASNRKTKKSIKVRHSRSDINLQNIAHICVQIRQGVSPTSARGTGDGSQASVETDIETAARLAPLTGFLTGIAPGAADRASPQPPTETDMETAARLAPLAGFLTGRDCPWFAIPYHHDLLRYVHRCSCQLLLRPVITFAHFWQKLCTGVCVCVCLCASGCLCACVCVCVCVCTAQNQFVQSCPLFVLLLGTLFSLCFCFWMFLWDTSSPLDWENWILLSFRWQQAEAALRRQHVIWSLQ